MLSMLHTDSSNIYAVFGGTFDPIHYGHLKPVISLANEVGLKHVSLLPNNVPPHRPQPEASVHQRLAMLHLAIKNTPLFSVDERELHRSSPSYTIDTLKELRNEKGNFLPIAFIIGQDSLLSLHRWYNWQSLLDYCHLLVCGRPGYSRVLETPQLQNWLTQHQTDDPEQLQYYPNGLIYLAHTPLLDISATEIRNRLKLGENCDDLLPPDVQHYIREQGLYYEYNQQNGKSLL